MPRKTNYNLAEIKKMRKAGKTWEEIAAHYGVKKWSVHRWYYRHRKDEQAPAPSSIPPTNGDVVILEKNSDFYRFVLYLLTGKVSRERIPVIKSKITRMMPEIRERSRTTQAPPVPPTKNEEAEWEAKYQQAQEKKRTRMATAGIDSKTVSVFREIVQQIKQGVKLTPIPT